VTDQVSHPYKTTGRIAVLYILFLKALRLAKICLWEGALSPSELRCERLPSVTTDGDRNINGSLTSVGRNCEEVIHVNS
jgi:hypothetical protein